MGYSIDVIVNAPLDRIWDAWMSGREAEMWLAPKVNIDGAVGEPFEVRNLSMRMRHVVLAIRLDPPPCASCRPPRLLTAG